MVVSFTRVTLVSQAVVARWKSSILCCAAKDNMFFFITTPSVQASKPVYDQVIYECTHCICSLHLGMVVGRQKEWRLLEDGVESSEQFCLLGQAFHGLRVIVDMKTQWLSSHFYGTSSFTVEVFSLLIVVWSALALHFCSCFFPVAHQTPWVS